MVGLVGSVYAKQSLRRDLYWANCSSVGTSFVPAYGSAIARLAGLLEKGLTGAWKLIAGRGRIHRRLAPWPASRSDAMLSIDLLVN